jgi:spoIIIJ-associated protein
LPPGARGPAIEASTVQFEVDWLRAVLRAHGEEDAGISVWDRAGTAMLAVTDLEDPDALLGSDGEALAALQLLLERAQETHGREGRVRLDVDDVFAGRDHALIEEARSAARSALESGEPVRLRMMNSYERHVVHDAIKAVPGVTSKSLGDGAVKQVEILRG